MEGVDLTTAAAAGQDGLKSLTQTSVSFRLALRLRRLSRQAGWITLVLLWLSPGPVTVGDYGLRLSLGLPWWMAALALRVWARGYHRSEGFVLNGPYRYVRNPVELGAVLAYVGAVFFLAIPLWWGALVVLVAVLYLSFLARAYENELVLTLGPSYFRYTRLVRRWIPSLLPGVNRAIRTYSVGYGLRYEAETALWLLGFGLIFGLRAKYGALW